MIHEDWMPWEQRGAERIWDALLAHRPSKVHPMSRWETHQLTGIPMGEISPCMAWLQRRLAVRYGIHVVGTRLGPGGGYFVDVDPDTLMRLAQSEAAQTFNRILRQLNQARSMVPFLPEDEGRYLVDDWQRALGKIRDVLTTLGADPGPITQ